MIQFVKSNNNINYYESDNYNIAISQSDNKIESIIITTKRYLYPDILCDISNGDCEISIKYDTIIINERRFKRFNDNYNDALQFIENVLKPFIKEKMQGC